MGRHKKNQSLIKSEDSTILVQTNSIVLQIENSKELTMAEKTYISDRFKDSGALATQEQQLKQKIAELNSEIKSSLAFKKKSGLQKILKQIKLEQTMTNNKVIGFIEMIQSKIEADEMSGDLMSILEANNERS